MWGAKYIEELCAKQWDLWEYDNVTIGAEEVKVLVRGMPRNKTCGRDMLVSEVWSAAIAADDRQAAHMAWATNQRVANAQMRRPPARKTSTDAYAQDAEHAQRAHHDTTCTHHASAHAHMPPPPHHVRSTPPQTHQTHPHDQHYSTERNCTCTDQDDAPQRLTTATRGTHTRPYDRPYGRASDETQTTTKGDDRTTKRRRGTDATDEAAARTRRHRDQQEATTDEETTRADATDEAAERARRSRERQGMQRSEQAAK